MYIRSSILIFLVTFFLLECMDQKPPRSVSWNLPPKTARSTEKKLIEKKEPISSKFFDTSLHKAARKGDSNAIKELINQSDVNAQNEVKDTALHIATLLLHPQCVQTLLEHNALFMVNERGITPLDTMNNYRYCFEKWCSGELLLKLKDDHSAITQLFEKHQQNLNVKHNSHIN